MSANFDVKDEQWRSFAACRNADPRIFFPQSELFSNQAKLICSTCPVRQQCLAWAMGTAQRDGVWGGRTAKERRRMAKESRRIDIAGAERAA